MAAKKAERSYGLSSDEVKQLTEEYKQTRKLPNPHRSGAYAHTISALVSLGINKSHPIGKVHQAFKRAAGEEWYRAWASKEPRNKATAKDADGRFLQNLQVLQRTGDYGRRLLEVGRRVMKTKGAVIDLSRNDKGNLFVMLNTNSANPQKAGRRVQDEPEKLLSPNSRKTVPPASKRTRGQKAKKRAVEEGGRVQPTETAPTSSLSES